MKRRMRRSNLSKIDKPSRMEKEQDKQEIKLLNNLHYLMASDERFISVDRLIDLENHIDDPWS